MSTFLLLLTLAAFAFFASKRLPRYLHIFQQDEYDASRFLPWLIKTRSFDKRVSLVLLALFILALIGNLPTWASSILTALIFVGFALREPDPTQAAKKKLVMTKRATRIFAVAIGLGVIAGLIIGQTSIGWVFLIQILPLLLVLANRLLQPIENWVKQKFMSEARTRLAEVSPTIIGITGSFGKTSVKHMLGHILELNAPTLFTPGSVNALLGIARIIRENLRDGCRFFLVEMGAYGLGSIATLCDFTPPQLGIITAIGDAHYERFKTLDTVARAKFQLAEAALKSPEGKMIIHENVLAQPYAAQFVERYTDRFIICGRSAQAAVKIHDFEQTAAGLIVNISYQGKDYKLFAPLFGSHHADNLVLAFTAAVMLGITPERAIAAMRTTPQIKHRLEVKPQADGSIYVDDAFNSNQQGFTAAVELLTKLAEAHGGRRILVTPGVTELGEKHDAVHQTLGEVTAKNVDIVLAVRPERIPTFISAFRTHATPDHLIEVPNLNAARAWLQANGQPKDIVLFENDLPDLYEAELKL